MARSRWLGRSGKVAAARSQWLANRVLRPPVLGSPVLGSPVSSIYKDNEWPQLLECICSFVPMV